MNANTYEQAKWGLTQSQLRVEKELATTPGNRISKRTTDSSDGVRRIFYRRGHCELVEVVGRRGGRTTVIRNPDVLSDTAGIFSLIEAQRNGRANA